MNQILFLPNYLKKRKNFIFIFTFSIIIIISLLIYSYSYFYRLKENKKLNNSLIQSFSITTLYNANNNYSNSSNNIYSPFIIGLLQIDKINLNYPIISYSSDELLKISICRFAGPMPNETGNLCIGGHNNIDNSFFGKLNRLNLGDNIRIYDLSGNYLDYTLYDKKEVLSNDLSCTNQNTNGKKIVTLVTCNTLKGTRIIYTASEKK